MQGAAATARSAAQDADPSAGGRTAELQLLLAHGGLCAGARHLLLCEYIARLGLSVVGVAAAVRSRAMLVAVAVAAAGAEAPVLWHSCHHSSNCALAGSCELVRVA